jgi:hypothetical protein
MRLFHRAVSAEAIRRSGFRDGEGPYPTGATLRGVFLSDVPLDCNEGARGKQLLAVTLPDEIDLSAYELAEEGKPYLEWCVPARLLNDHGTVAPVSAEEETAILRDRWLGKT